MSVQKAFLCKEHPYISAGSIVCGACAMSLLVLTILTQIISFQIGYGIACSISTVFCIALLCRIFQILKKNQSSSSMISNPALTQSQSHTNSDSQTSLNTMTVSSTSSTDDSMKSGSMLPEVSSTTSDSLPKPFDPLQPWYEAVQQDIKNSAYSPFRPRPATRYNLYNPINKEEDLQDLNKIMFVSWINCKRKIFNLCLMSVQPIAQNPANYKSTFDLFYFFVTTKNPLYKLLYNYGHNCDLDHFISLEREVSNGKTLLAHLIEMKNFEAAIFIVELGAQIHNISRQKNSSSLGKPETFLHASELLKQAGCPPQDKDPKQHAFYKKLEALLTPYPKQHAFYKKLEALLTP